MKNIKHSSHLNTDDIFGIHEVRKTILEVLNDLLRLETLLMSDSHEELKKNLQTVNLKNSFEEDKVTNYIFENRDQLKKLLQQKLKTVTNQMSFYNETVKKKQTEKAGNFLIAVLPSFYSFREELKSSKKNVTDKEKSAILYARLKKSIPSIETFQSSELEIKLYLDFLTEIKKGKYLTTDKKKFCQYLCNKCFSMNQDSDETYKYIVRKMKVPQSYEKHPQLCFGFSQEEIIESINFTKACNVNKQIEKFKRAAIQNITNTKEDISYFNKK